MNKKVHPNGIIECDVNWNGRNYPKTIFPEEWNDQTIMKKVLEALKNHGKLDQNGPSASIFFDGTTSCGIKIRFVAKPHTKKITFYPILK